METNEKKEIFLNKLYKKPKLLVGIVFGITVFFSIQLLRLKIDNNNFNFIPKNDLARVANDEVSKIFGYENPILIGIERKYSSILEKDFIEELRKLDDEFSSIPLVQKTVSIINTKHMEGEYGAMVAQPLIPEGYTGTPTEIESIRYKLRDWEDMYVRNLVSDDLQSVQFIIFLDISNDEAGSPEAIDVCRKVLSIADNWDFHDSTLYVTGSSVFSEVVNQATAHDLTYLIPIVIIIVVGVLFLSFRRFSGVVLPLLTVIISVVWSLGAMSLLGVPLSILSTVLPVILIAVGSAYGIHIVSHYFDDMLNENMVSKETHAEIVISGVKKIIRPVFLAALTTFAGFVSFCFTSVVPIFHFGIFSSFGVMTAFIVAVLLIPALLILRGPKMKKQHTGEFGGYKIDGFLANTFMIISGHKRSIFIVFILAIFFSIAGINRLVIDNILVEYFKNDHTISKADSFCRNHFAGSKQATVLVEADDYNIVTRPDVLLAMDGLSTYLTHNVKEVGKVTSVTDLIKRLNQVLNTDSPADGLEPVQITSSADSTSDDGFGALDDFGDFGALDDFNIASTNESVPHTETEYNSERFENMNFSEIIEIMNQSLKDQSSSNMSSSEFTNMIFKKLNYNGLTYYEIPSDPEKYGKTTQEELHGLINDYLILISSNTKDFMDNALNPKVLKMTVQLRTVGQHDTDIAINTIQDYIKEKFPKDVHVHIAGMSLIEKSLNNLVVQSQLVSLAISLVIVFLILTVFYKSIIAGIIGIIPLAISICINFAVMGFFGIKINIGTAMVASFAIGIGIDYTIHYLDAYHREIIRKQHHGDFLYRTFYGSGKAILFNALSVGAGFAVLTLSDFRMLADLGLLICLVMLTSSISSLTILPMLLNVFKPKFIKVVHKWDAYQLEDSNLNKTNENDSSMEE